MLIEIIRRFDISAHRDGQGYSVTWVKDCQTGARAVLYPEHFEVFRTQEGLEAAVAFVAEAQFISRITSHHNGNCCCMSCEPAYCFDCSHYSDFCTCPVPVSLYKSPLRRRDYANAGEPPF